MLTSPELGTPTAQGLGNGTANASVLDLAGFQSSGAATPWDGGCWDLVFTDDLPQSRPDPIVGQLQPELRLISLSSGATGAINPTYANPLMPAGDPVLFPLPQAMPPGGRRDPGELVRWLLLRTRRHRRGPITRWPLTTSRRSAAPCHQPAPSRTRTLPNPNPANPQWDPFTGGTPPGTLPAGVLPPPTYSGTPPTTYPKNTFTGFPTPGSASGARCGFASAGRPIRLLASPPRNPMIVVDAMRFPFIEAGGTPGSPPTQGPNYIFSVRAAPAVPGRARSARARHTRLA